ncbi:MAG TPA: tetratricopeptide repeat protein [bacterium]|nr:tetratricopeptide repeat protein [bacterium]
MLNLGRWVVLGMFLIPVGAGAQSDKGASAQVEPSYGSFKEAYSAGNDALKDRRFKDAAKAYGAAETLASTPKGKSQMANAQGWALLKAKDLEGAQKDFSRAVEQDAGNKVALKNLGVVEYHLYEYGLADAVILADVIKNLEASGDDPELLERAKADQTREESYAKSTPEPAPDLTRMGFKELCAYGDKIQEEGQFKEAMKVYKMAEDAAHSADAKGSAANRQGKLLLDTHHPADAVPHFERSLTYKLSDKEKKVFLNSLGVSYLAIYDSGKGKGGELKKAVDCFYQMNSIDPSYHHDNLEMALDELREVDPEAAKAYSAKDEGASDGDKNANDTSDKSKTDGDNKDGN